MSPKTRTITNPKWGFMALPDWVTEFREGQEEIIDDVHERFQQGAKVVFLQAPTGVGKSLIGECVRRLTAGPGIYTCTTKALQDQFVSDFPYGRVVKGRSNYLTLSGPLDRMGRRTTPTKNFVSCLDCTYNRDTGCRWCASRQGCPYIMARTQAENAELAILNTAYFLTDANKGRRRFAGR